MSTMESCRRHTTLLWAVCLILSIICVNVRIGSAEWLGDLSDYELTSFDNPDILGENERRASKFNHFTLSDHGDVHVGAVNWLYRLNGSLGEIQNVTTCDDSRPDSVMPCHLTNNYNKILVVDSTRPSSLITCGGVYDGICQLRQLEDIHDVVMESVPYVAGFEDASTVSVIAQGIGGNQTLYVGVTYTGQNLESGGVFPAITRRSLEMANFLSAVQNDNSIVFTAAAGINNLLIKYVLAFGYKGFTYFVTSQKEDLTNSAQFVSKMSRVCQGGPNLDAYTEITLQCSGSDGSVYSLVQAAHFGPAGPDLAASWGLTADEQVLYAVFAKNQGAPGTSDVPIDHSALCVYRMTDIWAAFREAVRGCIQNGNSFSVDYLEGSFCSSFGIPILDRYFCIPVTNDQNQLQLFQYAKGIDPVPSTAVLELPGTLMSSIITSIEVNHTVAFIGTSSGDLLKVYMESNIAARLSERVSLDTSPVLTDIKINETSGVIYVLTEQKLVKMQPENCDRYTTCEACIGTNAGNDGDPYCGWCTLERRCTRYHDCPLQDVSTRWLAYNDSQCIEISQVLPHNSLPITLTDQQIMLTVQQLPDLLDGEHYVCRFGDQFSSQATNYNGDSFDCRTPPANNIPAIPSGEDHVTVTLSVMSSETSVDFVHIDFGFYECDTHKSCVTCVGSRWACNWCLFENTCTHDNSTCSNPNEIIMTGQYSRGTAMQGPNSCQPQLQPQRGEVLVPSDINRQIVVAVDNPPDTAESFQCSLDVEGSTQSVAATRVHSSLICGMKAYTFTAAEQELNASLTLQWTDSNNVMHTVDDRYNFTVTLYKCEVLRPDCSRCISNETTRAELGCMWCGDTCGVIDSTVCMTADEKVTRNNTINCPDPLLKQVYPLFGPTEGNTLLTVSGTDIGLRYSDILEVKVGGQDCALDDYQYRTGSSVSCRTLGETATRRRRDVTPPSLQMTVTGRDGSMQASQGNVTFEYKNPMLDDINPKMGPQSGGTRLTISGQSLDAWRNIEVFIDDIPCVVDRARVTDDSITCITSRTDSLGSWIVNVSFDGVERFSMANYTYTVDPDVEEINPSTSVLAGGRELTVNGSGFSIIQQPQIVIIYGDNEQEFVGNCSVTSDDKMICTSPEINIPNLVLDADTSVNVTTGFIMDAVEALRTWCSVDQNDGCTPLEYFQNPEYYPFNDPAYGNVDGIEQQAGPDLTIKGVRLNLAITNEEVTVHIGKSLCTAVTVGAGALSCRLPEEGPAAGDYLGMNTTKGLPVVWVIHGNTLSFNIGYFQYAYNGEPSLLIPLVCSVSACVLLLVVLLAAVLYKKHKRSQKVADLPIEESGNQQKQVADDMKTDSGSL
ncbi:plexin-B1-like [Patiria miniata]|uniref:Sema domain-containing protein n=1 Tax=Patiria miniata TaxID=46514 RepID=A0A914ACX4_PATMI|nr:plexin-B1-like [Patiria miniata]